jgi:RNA polymerase sigma factor (sigma-70 family)
MSVRLPFLTLLTSDTSEPFFLLENQLLTPFASLAWLLPLVQARAKNKVEFFRNPFERRSAMRDRGLNRIGKSGITVASAAEKQLVAAAKRGDELAFESLFKRHQRRIFVLALRYTQIREDAEDVVQETFQKAFVHFHKFEGKSSFSTWATRIAINQALMLLRRRRALSEVPIDHPSSDDGATPAMEVPDAGADPEATSMQREEAQILSAAMRRLRPGMRTAVQLKELGELSNRETAGRMGVSVGAVKARLFHARRKLRETLIPYMRSRRVSRNGIPALANDAGPMSLAHLTCFRN